MSWKDYRSENPVLNEMYAWNSRVRDRAQSGQNASTPSRDLDAQFRCTDCEDSGVVPKKAKKTKKSKQTEKWEFKRCTCVEGIVELGEIFRR